MVTFISSQQPLGESAALRAHEHTFCKVGRNWEKWEKGNKILEVWQKKIAIYCPQGSGTLRQQ